MTELVNKLFKHSQDEGEKEFTFTEFLHLVDPNTGILAAHMRAQKEQSSGCLLYTSPSPRDGLLSRMPSSA